MTLIGNAVVAQSGGPTAVINNSVCGVIQEWNKKGAPGKLFGARFGIKGVLGEELVALPSTDDPFVTGLMHTPGAALGSCRHKIKDEQEYLDLINVFKKHNIRYFFLVGGNDSMDTCNKVYQLSHKVNYEMRVIGIPKTVDNDLPHTDHCPGYGSAAKYLATTVMETGLDLRGIISNNKIVILEAMGRHAGWLAAAGALAKREPNDAPHLIYLPEVAFSKEKFLQDVKTVYEQVGHVYIVASEGLVDEHGNYVCADDKKDGFGHVQLGGLADTLKSFIEAEMSVKVRCNILGSSQRAAMHYASLTDSQEANMVGAEAVKLAVQGKSGLMVTLERDDTDGYKCSAGCVDLSKVANVEKTFPLEWITPEGNFVTEEFIKYALPLIQGEVHIPTKNGLPDFCSLKTAL
ncbi:6-phosphofructokinase [Dethiobacter alkaliphilus]|uniref:6-phosphofructokinase n=1 Tax=Dethiobacter alkaliphilus TaxID=427926 RepID=UPI002226E6AA|nr:6-phosphofructokinase [Dethiobacter alkaliphilus]MCW3490004.1 6-phosphofructokinase [Dethiobacter alkaliphilus]